VFGLEQIGRPWISWDVGVKGYMMFGQKSPLALVFGRSMKRISMLRSLGHAKYVWLGVRPLEILGIHQCLYIIFQSTLLFDIVRLPHMFSFAT